MAKQESLLQKRIARELNANPDIKCIKVHGSPYLEIGTPDIIGCYKERMFCFEVKNPGIDEDGNFIEEPSNIQEKRLEQWEAVGAISIVIRSINEAFDALGLLEEKDGV